MLIDFCVHREGISPLTGAVSQLARLFRCTHNLTQSGFESRVKCIPGILLPAALIKMASTNVNAHFLKSAPNWRRFDTSVLKFIYMDPQQNTAESIIAPLRKVTPLSKYLAMIIFVAMPFIGAWIGYEYSPVKVVEVEKPLAVVDLQKEKSLLPLSELQSKFSEQISDRYEIEPLYSTKDNNAQYFSSSIPGSSACCGVYKYLPKTQSFYNTGIKIDMMIGEKESLTGRYVAKVIEGVFLEVYDLETQSLKESFRVSDEETLVSLTCGYSGDSVDLKWLDEHTLQYGVYKALKVEEGCPKMELIEYRTLQMK